MQATPEDRASLESARRMVCGDRGDIYVFDDGKFLVSSTAFALRPSHDPIDALIVAVSQAVKLHLAGVELGELRRDLVEAGMGEEQADSVLDHLLDVSVEDWAQVRARVDFYVNDNARIAAFDTGKSEGSS